MTKVTMELTGGFTISRGKRDAWTATASIDLDKVPKAMWPELAKHGLKQKIADSASQAKNEAEALGMMNKAIDAIVAGTWSTRGSGEGLSDVRSLAVHRLFKAALDTETAKRFRKLSASDQIRKALENAAVFDDDVITAAMISIEAERKARADIIAEYKKNVSKLTGKITINF